jgi:hypothetical protein
MDFVNNSRTPKNQPPAVPQGEVIANFKQYQDAQDFVDNLVKNDFPASSVAIVGSDLRTVERVRGKLNYARLAASGAVTGAWLGLAFGLIFGSSPTESGAALFPGIEALASPIFIGAGMGMIFNITRFGLSKNKRGYISASSVVAAKYQIQVPASLAEKAKAIPANTAKTAKN